MRESSVSTRPGAKLELHSLEGRLVPSSTGIPSSGPAITEDHRVTDAGQDNRHDITTEDAGTAPADESLPTAQKFRAPESMMSTLDETSLPVATISAAVTTTVEGTGDDLLVEFVFTGIGDGEEGRVVFPDFTISGTATENEDYIWGIDSEDFDLFGNKTVTFRLNPMDADSRSSAFEDPKTVIITLTDSSGTYTLGDPSEVTLTILDHDANSAPTAVSLDNSSVPENAGANATVGTLSSTDPDTGNTFTYSLVSGTGDTDNGSFSISGDQLVTSPSFDYETKNSYSVRVRTTDQGGLYTEQAFTISVTDINEDTSVSLSGTGSSTYGDSVTFTATVTPLTHGPAGPNGTVTFKDGSTTLGTGTLSGGVATFSTSALGAGSHSITAVYGGGTGYNGSTSSTGTQTVSKAHLTVTAANKTKVYGDANPALTTTITGFKNGETLATSGVTGAAGASTSATTASHVGDYTITASAGSLAAANYDFPTLADGLLTVSKAALTITADDKTKVYGASLPTLTASYGGFVNGDTSASLSSSPSLTTTATSGSSVAGGPYSITASGAASSDYTISYVSGSLTVTKVSLTVTAADKSKAYGASVPSLTYTASGFVNGDDAGDLSGSLSTTAALGSHVGSYPITQGSLGSGNYTISFTAGTLTVTKVALTVTADDQSKIYGDDLPELTYSASGFVNGDDESNLTGSLSTTATLASDVGSYSITQGSLGSGNYTITFTGATLDVTAAELTVTANNRNKVYGDSLPSLTYSTSGLVNGDTAGGVLTGSLATDATSASDVGSYSITQGTLAAGSNYTLTFNGATLSVTPATLSVTADHQTKVYGDDLPELTYSASGFVNGDDESVLSGALATDATSASDVGSYSITQGTLSAGSNYTISYHSSTLSVTAATLTVTADDQDKVYGDAVPSLTYSASGFVNGDPSSVLTGAPATTATLTSHVGTYSITQGTLSAGSNYSISYTAGTLTVKTAPVTVTASTPDAYEAGTQAGTFTFSRATPSAANGAAVVISYSLSGTAGSGDYSNATSGSVTIPANQTSVTLNLNPTNDNVMEPAETVVLTITSVSNTDYSASGSATVTIHDDDQTISVSKLQDGAEPGTPGIFRFARAGDLTVPTTVNVDVSGTATAGDDYVALGKIVDFGIGVSQVDVFVNVTDDDLIEGTETVIVSLAAPTDTHYLLASGSASQATVAILDDDAPPPKPDDDCGCSNTGNQTTTSANTGTSGSGNESSDGVVYATGAISVSNSDLSSVGFGQEWGVSRSYANIPGYAQASYAANNSVIGQNTYLITDPTGIIVAAEDGKTSQYFDPSGGSFVPRFFTQDTLTHDSDAGEYTLTTADGKKLVYNDFDSSRPGAQKGQLKSVTDSQGNTTAVTAYETGGQPQEVQRSSAAGGVTTIESYLYSYVDSGTNAGKIESITLRRKVDSGSWATVRTAEYAYYDTGSSLGTPGDLKSEVTKDADGQALDQSYSRYYTADSATGFAGGLKYTVSGDAYDRLTAAYPDPDTATDAELAPFATHYFEYDNVRRVTKHTESGTGCSTCADGLGTTTYSYATSPFENGFNNWRTKTVETLADGTVNTVYSNFAGETMLTVTQPAGSEDQWLTYQRYDESGRLIMTAQPSAVSGFDDSYADLLHDDAGNYEFLRDGEGLISTTTYGASTTATSSTAGNVEGYQHQTFLQRGESGDLVLQNTTQYFSRTAGDVTVYPVAAMTQYRNDDGTGAQTTTYAYTYFSGTIQPESVTTTRPTVTSAENGPDTAESDVAVMDDRGRVTWTKDAGGFISYTEYDDATGGMVKTIRDVDTTQTGTFANLPADWTTPTGGGLQQTTTYELDDQGRATKVTDPNGHITYTVHNDSAHETRTYPGWDSTTNTPTGPTTVSREDREYGYTETLTMSASPDVSDGRPTGAEDISDVQSLSRQVVNDAGQVLYSDQYTDLTGVTYSQSSVTLGTAGTNYLRTSYAYDDVGRLRKTVTPGGTISRTVFDGLGRTASSWVGTDDTPTTGYWSPSNTTGTNLVKVSENEYDNGDVGDGNVTKQTQIPGGGEADRVMTYSHDWRDRTVVTKAGVETSEDTSLNRPVSYVEYDNLGEAVVSEQYDGDGLSITTDVGSDGVPDRPDSGELRAKSVTSYDEQGRVFRNENYSVDPSSGTVSTYSLRTDSWFDSRGNTVKSSSPGSAVTKTAYDGLGRPTVSYVVDSADDSSYADAADVTGDAVLTQTEMTYDNGGNVLLTTTRERFHDETGTGELGTPSTGNKARVSYQASYYDDADRLTASEDVGTNGGSAFTRPGEPDDRDDTHLITSYGYDAAGRLQTTTDPMGLVSKTYYDAAGRTVKTIENYVDGTVSDGDDKTVEYVYGANGQMQKLQAKLTGGGQQETGYVYGVTTGQGSTLDSNEIAYQTQYPDATTGNASAGDVESTTVNNLGQTLTQTDRNGTKHTYAYDVLGRQISDTVTTLGSGVDGAVRRVETSYDTQGNVYQITSYDAVTGGNVVNQIQRAYNGLGQMTTEYQATAGSVDTETTPKVQYAYSEMAGAANHSRLTSMTYPNGRELDYNYDPGVGNDISRLTFISDDNRRLEQEQYLGLNTVVNRMSGAGVYLDDVVVKSSPDVSPASGYGGGAGTQSGGDGSLIDWTNSGSATESDNVYTNVRLSDGQTSTYLDFSNFNLSVPEGATITGYAVNVERKVNSLEGDGTVRDTVVQLIQDGNPIGDNLANTDEDWAETAPDDDNVVYGGDGESWGVDLTPSDVNDGSFGVRIQVAGAGDDIDALIDSVSISVFYAGADFVPTIGDAGDQYLGLDRFGRSVQQSWLMGGDSLIDARQYGYDRDGNRLYMDNTTSPSNSELYSYDGLNQLSSFQRGTLDETKTGLADTAQRSQSWDYDALGNFDSQTTDGVGQTRTANKQNEITSISGATTPTYDLDGNLTTDETGRTFTYDAWNRLATVTSSGSTLQATYKWDGAGRRVEEVRGGTTTDLYYSAQWQVLEERVDGATTTSYAWSPVYVDAMIARDRDTNADGSLDERLYAMQDANFNVIGLMDTSGNVVERYQYDPFGGFNVFAGSGEAVGDSAYAWNYLFQGGRWDADGGVYSFRNRELSPTLGRWLQVDPAFFNSGDINLYRAMEDNPIRLIDPMGLTGKIYVFSFEGAGGKEFGISNPMDETGVVGKTVVDTITSRGVQSVFSYRSSLGPFAEGDIEKVIKNVKDKENGCPSIILIGYSWGAITTARVAKNVSNDTKYKFGLVFTIDPVPLGRNDEPNVSKEFGAKKYANNWINYYQTEDTLNLFGFARGVSVDGATDDVHVPARFLRAQLPNLKDDKGNKLDAGKAGHTSIVLYPPLLTSLRVAVDGMAAGVQDD
ncbi:MBG domain-containing protein [Zavarzinella formosa]|uniref:MBG domain-containing protein n=1 Tax=Zavarzinella formosa TaxID=360055 RepID=UPI0003626003|nr:MBG domain-containing protein [Zavarzinella formosa]